MYGRLVAEAMWTVRPAARILARLGLGAGAHVFAGRMVLAAGSRAASREAANLNPGLPLANSRHPGKLSRLAIGWNSGVTSGVFGDSGRRGYGAVDR